MQIEVALADITTIHAEVLVTAANTALAGGGGVDGAIHRAAGPELLRALQPLAPCPAGAAVITPAFELPAPVRHVIHAVGPRYGVDEPAADLLASAYLTSLHLCDEVGAASVAFPSLSTGAFGFPLLQACQISVATLLNASTQVEYCTLVAFDIKAKKFWERTLASPHTQEKRHRNRHAMTASEVSGMVVRSTRTAAVAGVQFSNYLRTGW